MRNVFRDPSGGTLVYVTIVMLIALGAGALAFDIGRMAILRSEMQNRVDAGAMGGAFYLNGSTGSRTRAENIARNAVTQYSSIAPEQAPLQVQNVNFYRQYFPTKEPAANDLEAVYIEVTLVPRQIDFIFGPLMDSMAGAGSVTNPNFMQAIAVAGPDPFICNAPPLMMCNLAEEDPSLDFFDPVTGGDHIGKQVVLKEPQGGHATLAPGNFGLLALPDGAIGANDIEDALAAVEPQQCYKLDVTTAPGSKTQKVKDGINARFDMPGNPHPYPAPNVMAFPRDVEVLADPDNTKIGSGNWGLDDPGGYWDQLHGGPPPADLANASRFQVYLYEMGEEFARDGKKTLYPVPADFDPALAQYSTFTLVTPPGADIPTSVSDPHNPEVDGVPSTSVAANGYARRLVKVAVIDCIAEQVKGTGTYPTEGRFVEMFVTEPVKDPPDAAIYGEVIRPITTVNSPDFHANVRLVQ